MSRFSFPPIFFSDRPISRPVKGLALAALLSFIACLPAVAAKQAQPDEKQTQVDKWIDSLKLYPDGRGAVEALGEIKDPWAVEPLLTLLAESDGDVRAKAAGALGAIKDPRAIQPLIAA